MDGHVISSSFVIESPLTLKGNHVFPLCIMYNNIFNGIRIIITRNYSNFLHMFENIFGHAENVVKKCTYVRLFIIKKQTNKKKYYLDNVPHMDRISIHLWICGIFLAAPQLETVFSYENQFIYIEDKQIVGLILTWSMSIFHVVSKMI